MDAVPQNDVVIGFIGDEDQIVSRRKLCDLPQLLPGENAAKWDCAAN